MFPRLVPIVAFVVIQTACAHSQVKSTFGKQDQQSIRNVLAAQSAAWNRGDLEAFMDGYARTPELVFTAGGAVERGWAETLARYQGATATTRHRWAS